MGSLAPPPRTALFIAALALAAAHAFKLPAPKLPTATPARLERRARSIAAILRALGQAIVTSGQVEQAFTEKRALGTLNRPALAAPPLDPLAAAIIESPLVVSAIGKPDAAPLWRNAEAGRKLWTSDLWLEIARTAPAPYVKLYWRGEWDEEAQARRLELRRFRTGVEGARRALLSAGFQLSGLIEVRTYEERRCMPFPDGPTFRGAVATIGLARPRPSLLRVVTPEHTKR